MAEAEGARKSSAPDQREIKALKKELQPQEKAMAEMAPCWCCEKMGAFCLGGRGRG